MSNYRILLLDYEPRSIAQAKAPLEAAGFEVAVATDGVAGIEAFNRLHPDLVLIEAMLPKKHGFEVCQEIKRTPEGKRTPIVITTGVYRGRKYRSQALHIHGCDEYLEKPFASDLLVSLCQRMLGNGESVSTMVPGVPEASTDQGLEDAGPNPTPAGDAPPRSYAASIISDLSEDEIIARLDALLPGDAMDVEVMTGEVAPASDRSEASGEEPSPELESVVESLEDLLGPLPPPPADEVPLREEAPQIGANLEPAGVAPGPISEPEADPHPSEEISQSGDPEPIEPARDFSPVGGESWASGLSGIEDATIDSILDEKLSPGGAPSTKAERPQIVPFDSNRSKKRRQASGGASRPSEPSFSSADAIAVAEVAPVERPARAVPPPAAAERPVPAARPHVNFPAPRPAFATPAEPQKKTSWWMWVAAAVVAGAAFYLVFKPTASGPPELPVEPVEESQEPALPGPDAPRVETATPPAERTSAGRRDDAPATAPGSPRGAAGRDDPRNEVQKAPVPPPTLPAATESREPKPKGRTGEATADATRKPWDLKVGGEENPSAASAPVEAARRPEPALDAAEPAVEPPSEAKKAEILPPAAPEPTLSEIPAPRTMVGDLVSIEDVDTPPIPVSRPAPAYTARARTLRQQGAVLLNLLVDENGKVSEIQVIQGIAASDLTDAARQAAKTWTYHPATKNGVRVKVWKLEKINFSL